MRILPKKHEILICLIKKGMNQKDLALRTGISESALSNFINGKFSISAKKASLICRELQKEFDELFFIKRQGG